MNPEWLAVPFNATEIHENLEDMASCANIPRLSVLNLAKSTTEMQLKDVKSIILRN